LAGEARETATWEGKEKTKEKTKEKAPSRREGRIELEDKIKNTIPSLRSHPGGTEN